jgi:hypothetical protein
MPAVKIVAGLLILAVTVGLLQVSGTTSASANHATGPQSSRQPAVAPVFASMASAGNGLGTAGRVTKSAAAAVRIVTRGSAARTGRTGRTGRTCKPTTAVAARAGHRLGLERPQFVVRHHASLALAGKTVAIRGRLKDACGGVRVRLQQRRGHHWKALTSVRVSRHGRFHLRYRAPEVGTAGLRVDFGGGHGLRAATASVGAVTSMHPAVASWYYDDTGATGCGFQATYGVANKTLPCGTKVTLSYGGRTVVATVDDRGPYVYGRTFDLGINTRNALGMNGVVTLLASS